MDYVLKSLNFLFIILEVLLIFNLLIVVHEIGHFLAARWQGLIVEEFGIWFGKPLWKKKINGVNYSFGCIPFGGFVKLPQMAPMETMEGQSEFKPEDMPKISPLKKIIVAFAGPLFSFGLAFVFAVIVWGVGRPVGETEKTTVVGYVMPGSPAEKAGFQIGDDITEVDGHKVTRWLGMGDSIIWSIVSSEGKSVDIKVLRDGKEITLSADPKVPEKAHWWNRQGLRQIGLAPEYTVVVGKVDAGSVADKAGLKKDDRLLQINGQKLYAPDGIYVYMKDHPESAYTFTVQRGAGTVQIPFTPDGVKVEEIPDYPNSPAKATDLKVGDIVTGIDGKILPGNVALTDYVHSHGGVPIILNVTRDGKPLPPIKVIPSVPENSPDGDDAKPMIGVLWTNNDGLAFDSMGVPTVSNPSPVEQIQSSMMMIVSTFDAVLSPKSSIGFQHMGGPVMMMNAYYSMLDTHDGWKRALWFSVILNVNLALLNLLPIPVLDGGHITLAVIEAIRRRPVNLKALEMVQSACAIVIIGFMLFIVFFDVQDLPFLSNQAPPIRFKAPSAENSR